MARSYIIRASHLIAGSALLILGAGCSATRQVNTAEDFAAIADRARKHTAVVVLMPDRNTMTVTGLEIRADSASWIDRETGIFYHVPVDRLQGVALPSPSRVQNTLLGAGVGLAAGAALGGLSAQGLATFESDGPGMFGGPAIKPGTYESPTWLVPVGAALGAVLGGVAGRSRRIYYLLVPPSMDGGATVARPETGADP